MMKKNYARCDKCETTYNIAHPKNKIRVWKIQKNNDIPIQLCDTCIIELSRCKTNEEVEQFANDIMHNSCVFWKGGKYGKEN